MFSFSDILRLSTFVTTNKQNDKLISIPTKINAIARSVVNSELVNTFTDRLGITEVS